MVDDSKAVLLVPLTTNDLRAESIQAQLAAIVNSSGDAIIGETLDGTITSWNSSATRIFGYSASEVIGKSMMLLVPPERANERFNILRQIATGKHLKQFETVHIGKNGSRIEISATISPLPDASGKIIGTAQIARVIDEKNRLLRQLQESEERFRTMANSMSQMAWIAHADGHIFWYNDRWYEYTGMTPEQMKGWGWQCVHDPEELPRVLQAWKGAIAAGCPLEIEFPLRGADGLFRSFLTRVVPVIDVQGNISHWCGTNTNVQTLKETEEKILRENEMLERRVAERTSQLQTTNLKLEAANKELDSFCYSVSHDLHAPLRGIDGYVRMLKEDCVSRLDDEGNRMLDVVSNEARRMGRLINDLLAFSRIGRETLKRTTVDMTSLARTCFESAVASVATIPKFELHLLPPATGDLALLRQVFTNLIGNAIKFSARHSQPAIEIGGRNHDAGSLFYIKDNGVGFDEKYIHKLFCVFQRLHSEEEFEGTGVGLAIVQRVIQRHGGSVWAEGKLGEGATFYFTLPI